MERRRRINISRNTSGDEMKGDVLRRDPKTYDKTNKFLQKQYEFAKQKAVRDGKQEIGSSNEIVPATQGASQDAREKSLRQDSSVPDSPRDPSHLVERVRALEHDACNKEHLFVTKMQEYRSLKKEIIQLRKRRATLKRTYQPLMVEMKRLKSKVQKQKQTIHELNLLANNIAEDFISKSIEPRQIADKTVYEDLKEEYEIKQRALEDLKAEIKEKERQKSHFERTLCKIKESQDKIEKIKDYENRQKDILCNEEWIKYMNTKETEIKECSEKNNKYAANLIEVIEENNSAIEDINFIKCKKNQKTAIFLIEALNKINAKTVELLTRCQAIIKYQNSRSEQIKKEIKITDDRNKCLKEINAFDQIIDENTALIKENNMSENTINFSENINNDGLIYLKKQIEMIKDYNLKNAEAKIKDFESRYEKLQDSMPHIEELKEANRIAKQDISQYQWDHRLYLIERQEIMKEFGLKDKGFLQNKEINIQNPEVDQNEHIKILNDRIEEIGKEIKKINDRKSVITNIIAQQEKDMTNYLDNQTKILVSMNELNRNVTFDSKKAENYLELEKSRNEWLERLSTEGEKLLQKKDEERILKWNISEIKQNRYDKQLKEIESYQSAKSNLENEIKAELAKIKSQLETDFHNLRQDHKEKETELKALKSVLEDLEKKMYPETQEELQEQFKDQINKIQSHADIINKELLTDYKRLEGVENILNDDKNKREPLTREIKHYQNKLKEKKEEIDRIDEEWLRIKIDADKARSSLESSMIERAIDKRNIHSNTSEERHSIASRFQGDTNTRTGEPLEAIPAQEHDYSIIRSYSERIKSNHENLDKLNNNLIKLYKEQKNLRKSIIKNKDRINKLYSSKYILEKCAASVAKELHKEIYKGLYDAQTFYARQSEYYFAMQELSKANEKYRYSTKKREALEKTIAILDRMISLSDSQDHTAIRQRIEDIFKEKRSMFTTFPNALDGVISALGSQDHTIRQQGQAVLKDMLEASRHELAAAQQKEERLKKKVKQCEEELAIKETQLNNLEPPEDLWRKRSYIAKHHRWNEKRGDIKFVCDLLREAKQQRSKLNNHLARVKEQIQAIETHKAQYQSENAEILQTLQKLSGEETEKAHTDSPLHSHESSSSELTNRDALTVQQHAEVDRQMESLDDQDNPNK